MLPFLPRAPSRHRPYSPFHSAPRGGTVRAFGLRESSGFRLLGSPARSGLLRPLLTPAPRSGRLAAPPVPSDTTQASRDKSDRLPRATARSTGSTPRRIWASRCAARSPGSPRLAPSSCSSARVSVPRFLRTCPHEPALALPWPFASVRLGRGLSPPGDWTCTAYSDGVAGGYAERAASRGGTAGAPSRERPRAHRPAILRRRITNRRDRGG